MFGKIHENMIFGVSGVMLAFPRLIQDIFGKKYEICWHFQRHFDVICILRRYQSNILLFGFKLLSWSQTMFLKHEPWIRISFLSIFDAWRQISACCSMNLRWSLNFLPSVSQGVRGGRRVLRTMKGNYLTAKCNQKSKVHCFLRSWLVPASVSMLIFMFSSFVTSTS